MFTDQYIYVDRGILFGLSWRINIEKLHDTVKQQVLKTAASTAHFINCFIHTQLKHSHTGLMDEKALFNGYFATLIWIIAYPLRQ